MWSDLSTLFPSEQPAGWKVVSLRSVAAPITKGATPTTYGFAWNAESDESGIPFLRSECVQDGMFVPTATERIPNQAHLIMRRSAIKGGDVLITITGYIGKVCQYPENAPEANINQHIARVRITSGQLLDTRYAFWALHNPRQKIRLEKDLTGLAYPQISLAQVQAIPLPLPPLPEQRRIVEVLDTLDEAIRKTAQVVAKLQQMKQGLLHDLLTRGIDDNGELRDLERHPEQFKKSPLGKIPREWEARPLGKLLAVRLGFAFRSEDYVKRGMLNFRVLNIGRPTTDFGDMQYLPRSFWSKFPGQQLYGGEIMIVMVGATTGKLGRVPTSVCPALQNQNMWNLVPVEDVSHDFLWLLLPDAVRRHMSLSQGSARDFLTQRDFIQTLAPWCPPKEQARISSAFLSFQSRLDSEGGELMTS